MQTFCHTATLAAAATASDEATRITAGGLAFSFVATMTLVLLNGFFVAAEFAAVGARQSRLEATPRPGLLTMLCLQVKRHLDLYLSSCQLGITLASLALGYVLEPAIVALIEPMLQSTGLPTPNTHLIAVGIALAIGTTLHVVVGEVAPKNAAIYHPDAMLPWIAPPLIAFTYLFYPLIWVLNSMSNMLLRLVGIPVGPGAHSTIPHTVKELRSLLNESVEQGAIPETAEDILTSAFDFGDLKARQIMTPRTSVDFLTVGQPIDQVLNIIRHTAFTRLPLCEGDMDHVLGLVHVKDLFNQLALVPGRLRFADEKTPDGMAIAIADGLPGSAVHVIGSADLDLLTIKREVFFVPEMLAVPKLLRLFQSSRTHLAVVVDEYGATQGIVTLEDVIEEIVGEIEDEFDVGVQKDLVRDADGYRATGLYPLHELRDELGLNGVDFGDVDTLNGYLVRELGRWPKVGDTVPLGPFDARVLSVQQRRAMQVHITPRPAEQPGAGDV